MLFDFLIRSNAPQVILIKAPHAILINAPHDLIARQTSYRNYGCKSVLGSLTGSGLKLSEFKISVGDAIVSCVRKARRDL